MLINVTSHRLVLFRGQIFVAGNDQIDLLLLDCTQGFCTIGVRDSDTAPELSAGRIAARREKEIRGPRIRLWEKIAALGDALLDPGGNLFNLARLVGRV